MRTFIISNDNIVEFPNARLTDVKNALREVGYPTTTFTRTYKGSSTTAIFWLLRFSKNEGVTNKIESALSFIGGLKFDKQRLPKERIARRAYQQQRTSQYLIDNNLTPLP